MGLLSGGAVFSLASTPSVDFEQVGGIVVIVSNAANAASIPTGTKLVYSQTQDTATGAVTASYYDPATGISYPATTLDFQSDVQLAMSAAPSVSAPVSTLDKAVKSVTTVSQGFLTTEVPANAKTAIVQYLALSGNILWTRTDGSDAVSDESFGTMGGNIIMLESMADIQKFRFLDGGSATNKIYVEFRG